MSSGRIRDWVGLDWFSLIQVSSGGLALRLMSYLHTGGAFGGIIMGVLQIERAIAGAVNTFWTIAHHIKWWLKANSGI